jgi:hypothetical protein
MIGRSAILSILWLALSFGFATGREPSNAGQFQSQIESLRQSLGVWQQTLNAIDIGQLGVGKDQYSSLTGTRDSAIFWLEAIRNQLPALEKESAFSDQARLLLDIVQFQSGVSIYSQDFGRVYQASGDVSKVSPGNLALKWMNQTGAIVSEVQADYENLSDTVFRRMDAANEQLKKAGCSYQR